METFLSNLSGLLLPNNEDIFIEIAGNVIMVVTGLRPAYSLGFLPYWKPTISNQKFNKILKLLEENDDLFVTVIDKVKMYRSHIDKTITLKEVYIFPVKETNAQNIVKSISSGNKDPFHVLQHRFGVAMGYLTPFPPEEKDLPLIRWGLNLNGLDSSGKKHQIMTEMLLKKPDIPFLQNRIKKIQKNIGKYLNMNVQYDLTEYHNEEGKKRYVWKSEPSIITPSYN